MLFKITGHIINVSCVTFLKLIMYKSYKCIRKTYEEDIVPDFI